MKEAMIVLSPIVLTLLGVLTYVFWGDGWYIGLTIILISLTGTSLIVRWIQYAVENLI